jgi:hypothetical protein
MMQTLFETMPRNGDVDPELSAMNRGRAKNARTKLTPGELAAQWGKKPSTILALIKTGELRAIDVSVDRGRRTFLIDLADIAIFEERRTVQPPTPPGRRRRRLKREPEGATFF